MEQLCGELECPICHSPYVTPVTIQCGHTYCCSCIHTHWSRKLRDEALLCPMCRAPHTGAWAVNTWAQRLASATVAADESAECEHEAVRDTTKAEYLHSVVLAEDCERRRATILHARLNKFYTLYKSLDLSDVKQTLELLCCAAAVLALFKTSGSASPTILGEEARFLCTLGRI